MITLETELGATTKSIAGQSKRPGSYHEDSVPHMVDGPYDYVHVPDHHRLFDGLGSDYGFVTSAWESTSAGGIWDAHRGLEQFERNHPDKASRVRVAGSATLEVSLEVYGGEDIELKPNTEGVAVYQETAEGQISGWLERHPGLTPHFVEDSAEAPERALELIRQGAKAFAVCPPGAGDRYDDLRNRGVASNKFGGTNFLLFAAAGEVDPNGSHSMIRFRANHAKGGLLLPLSDVTDQHNLSYLAVVNVNGHTSVDALAEVKAEPGEVEKTLTMINERNPGAEAYEYGRYTPTDNRREIEGAHYEDYDINELVQEIPEGQTVIGVHCLEERGALTSELAVLKDIEVNLLGLDVPVAPVNARRERPILLRMSHADAGKVSDNQAKLSSKVVFPK